jgi:hypothetical protein
MQIINYVDYKADEIKVHRLTTTIATGKTGERRRHVYFYYSLSDNLGWDCIPEIMITLYTWL